MIKNKKTGQLIVISAPSGSGKDTIVKELMKKYGENKWVSVSATSREARGGEKDGVDYFFLTKEDFEEQFTKTIKNILSDYSEKRDIHEYLNVLNEWKKLINLK